MKLFSNYNFTGSNVTVTQDNGCFYGSPLNDWASSLCLGANCPTPPPVPLIDIKGYIKDATTGTPIADNLLSSGAVSVTFTGPRGNSFAAEILAGGIYEVKLPAGKYKRVAKLGNYADNNNPDVDIQTSTDQSNEANTILLVPIIKGWNVVLTWNNVVQDLDLYAKLPDGNLIFYRNKASDDGKVTLDVDARHGFGPETLSFHDIGHGKFLIFVNNYSNDAPIGQSDAKVTIYADGKQLKRFDVKPDATALWWKVAEIDMDAKRHNPIEIYQDDSS